MSPFMYTFLTIMVCAILTFATRAVPFVLFGRGDEPPEIVKYLGKIDYNDLPNYAHYFDICIIPFLINDITKATNPVKLFEYMALGKPIVTTALPECRKYESPLVSDSHEEFINNIKKAAELENSKEYIELLRKEGNQNTWRQKAKDIKELILNS